MKLKRNGWLIRFCYLLEGEKAIPQQTSLCGLFWRFIGMLIVSIFLGPVCGLILIILTILATVVGFLFACRPHIDNILVPIAKWPKISGHRIWPLSVIGPPAVLYVMVSGTVDYLANGQIPSDFIGILGVVSTGTAGVVIFGLIAIMAIDFARILYNKASEAESLQLIRAWLKAKHEKVCPFVEIE
jgi:hypothetical protein